MTRLKNRWNGKGGYREVLILATPLILSTASWSVQHFVDRMFLSWYSSEALAAAMPAGMLHFSMVSIFMGTVGYVGTFVAQYHGASMYHRIGPAIWQSIYISLVGGLLLLCAIPFAEPVFRLIGHSGQDQRNGGNRALLSADQRAEIKQKLLQYTPQDIFGPEHQSTGARAYWSVPDLRRAVERWTGVVYQSAQSYRDLLRDCGFSYQRTERRYRSRKEVDVATFSEQVEKN